MAGKNTQKQSNAKSKSRKLKLKEGMFAALIGAFATIMAAILTVLPWKEWFAPDLPINPTASAQVAASALPSKIFDNKGGALLLVASGKFIMGSIREDVFNGAVDEKPSHEVYLNSFYIDKFEVTNFLYRECVNTGVCNSPKNLSSQTRNNYFDSSQFDDYPVVYVDWNMANVYCGWRGARLPTEAEWEKAARGTDGRTYPWGEEIDKTIANYDSDYGDTSIVGAYIGQSPYGLYDMTGNVLEWVQDWYAKDYYQITQLSNPLGPETGEKHVARGGAWNLYSISSTSTTRYSYLPSEARENLGFRCVKDIIP